MSKSTTLFTLPEESIMKLSQRDINAFNRKEKSYELNNWLKDELVIHAYNQAWKELNFKCSVKTYIKIASLLAYYRETNLITSQIKTIINDREEVITTLKICEENLTNQYRRYLNNTYAGIEIPYAESEENFDDYEVIQHTF